MFKIIVLVVVGLVAALLIYAAARPDTFRVQRELRINAPLEKIFGFINDLHSWVAWSPWERMDPDLKRTYSGSAQGKGAVYEWEGNGKVGRGRMEIAESSPPSHIAIKLDFIKPFEAHNIAEFTLEDQGGSTNVMWVMHGPSPYIAKVIHTFVSMDRMVGTQFEQGLANLKTIAEQ